MTTPRLIFRKLSFTGPNKVQSDIFFQDGLNIVYGASNTGKSFTLKAIDFMLGGKNLPEFSERGGYDQIWLCITVVDRGDFTLSRSVTGGPYSLHIGLTTTATLNPKILSASSPKKPKKSLSHFMLDYLGFANHQLAKNEDGVTQNISFRDLTHISLVDEMSIQSERSPVESGQVVSRTKERSFFKLMITGVDDSALIAVTDDKSFSTSKAVRIEVITQFLDRTNAELSEVYKDHENLPNQLQNLSSNLLDIQAVFDALQKSVRSLGEQKRDLSIKIPQTGQRLDDVNIHLERFSRLDDIYLSDIERLAALKEASYLISLAEGRPCSSCGAPPESQTGIHQLENIKEIEDAAIIEILKIKIQQEDLKQAIIDLEKEKILLESKLPELSDDLKIVEASIADLTPVVSANTTRLQSFLVARDHVKRGIALVEQRSDYLARIEGYKNQKRPGKSEKPNLKAPTYATHEFSQVVQEVLTAWHFPGDNVVSFDEKTYDLKIDGKLRTHNGKGVRAVTHAAFKVALLLYCRRKNLPHPGFVVLDTPLLTYRDPLKNTKAGPLSPDEKVVAQSALKVRFFEHLASLSSIGQFIVLENIDPPSAIDQLAHIEVFSGNGNEGRAGLFPV